MWRKLRNEWKNIDESTMEKLKEALDQREEISNVESMEWCEDG